MDNHTPVLLVPGLGGSDAAHWQARWCESYDECEFLPAVNWNIPDLGTWLNSLDDAIRAASKPPVLVAHSLGCALVAHWVTHAHKNSPVHGALLVAPADVDSEAHTPPETRPFSPMPLNVLPFPTIVVASDNDPYVDARRAQLFATAWGAEYVNIGLHGHINADSHLGDWPQGWALLKDLVREESRLSRA